MVKVEPLAIWFAWTASEKQAQGHIDMQGSSRRDGELIDAIGSKGWAWCSQKKRRSELMQNFTSPTHQSLFQLLRAEASVGK